MSATIVDDKEALRAKARARFAAAGLCGDPSKSNPATPGPSGALSSAPFAIDFDPRAVGARNGAQSMYQGTLAATLLDCDLVSAILPAAMDLAPLFDPAQTPTQHPVLYLLGRQEDPLGLLNGATVTIPGAVPYNELILLIPFAVRKGGASRWHSFAARMYLDESVAIGIGDGLYAYSKEWGDFDWFGDLAEIRSVGITIFEAEVTELGGWMSAANAAMALPGFLDATRILEMPIVGYNRLRGYVRSFFEWDYTLAEVAPARSLHRFHREFVPGMQPWVALGYLASAENAAFKLRNVRWRL